MTTLRRAAELNTGNYDFLGLSPVIKALVEAAKAAHELTIWLDMTREEIAALKEGEDELDEQPLMDHARDMYDAWELWQRLENRVAPILARELDKQPELTEEEAEERRQTAWSDAVWHNL